MGSKLIYIYAILVACVLGVTACSKDSDTPSILDGERIVEAPVAGEPPTRTSNPSIPGTQSEAEPSSGQRIPTLPSPPPLTRTSADLAASANSSDFQTRLLALAHIDEIEALLAMYRYEEALEKLDAAEHSIDGLASTRALYLRGVINSRLGRYEEAWPMLSNLIEDSSRASDVRFVSVALAELGHIYFLTGDFETATAFLERAVNYQPSFGLKYLATYYRGLIRLSEFDYEGAHSDLVYAVYNSPRDWELKGEAMLFLVDAHNTDPHAGTTERLEFAESLGYDRDRLSDLREIVSSR